MFQRMIAIPQEEYMQMSAVQSVKQPLTEQFFHVEKQLTQAEQVRDPYRRMILQGEALNEMKDLKEKMRNNIKVATPKPYVNRAKALYGSVESFLRFNEKGELMDKNNQVISQSRVEDLIQHAVRDRRRNITPIGWSSFLDILREHNIPKSTLNRQTLEELGSVRKADAFPIKTEKGVEVFPIKKAAVKRRRSTSPSPLRVRKSSRKIKPKVKPDFLHKF